MEEGTIKTGDIVSGAVLAGLGIYIIVEARGWEYLGPDGPGPGFFPLWYGIALVGLSLLLIGTSFRGAAAGKPVDWREVGRALTVWVGLALCVGLLKILGFVLAFGLFTFFLVKVMYRRPFGTAAMVSVGIAAMFYLLFPLALNVAMPVGKLGF